MPSCNELPLKFSPNRDKCNASQPTRSHQYMTSVEIARVFDAKQRSAVAHAQMRERTDTEECKQVLDCRVAHKSPAISRIFPLLQPHWHAATRVSASSHEWRSTRESEPFIELYRHCHCLLDFTPYRLQRLALRKRDRAELDAPVRPDAHIRCRRNLAPSSLNLERARKTTTSKRYCPHLAVDHDGAQE